MCTIHYIYVVAQHPRLPGRADAEVAEEVLHDLVAVDVGLPGQRVDSRGALLVQRPTELRGLVDKGKPAGGTARWNSTAKK